LNPAIAGNSPINPIINHSKYGGLFLAISSIFGISDSQVIPSHGWFMKISPTWFKKNINNKKMYIVHH
jgi:hypothetical protein